MLRSGFHYRPSALPMPKRPSPKNLSSRSKKKPAVSWNGELDRIKVSGNPEEARLFYSLLYRAQQAPFDVTESDGTYHGSDGVIRHTDSKAYNGWSIWDNYKTAFPLLSIIQPEKYKDMITSMASLYRADKRGWSTNTEPSNSVRKRAFDCSPSGCLPQGIPGGFSIDP